MKKKLYLLLSAFLIILSTSLTAQTIKIDTTSITFEDKLRPCFQVNVDQQPKDLKKAWVKYLKKNYAVKLKGIGLFSNKDMLKGEDVTLSKISGKRMNIYTRVTEDGSGSQMKFFASFGYDFFIGPEKFPAEFKAMNEILNSFLLEDLNEFYTDEIKSIGKDNDKMNKDIDKLEKDISKNQGMIGSNESVITGGSDKSAKLTDENKKLEDKIRDSKIEIHTLKLKIDENNKRNEFLRDKQTNLLQKN